MEVAPKIDATEVEQPHAPSSSSSSSAIAADAAASASSSSSKKHNRTTNKGSGNAPNGRKPYPRNQSSNPNPSRGGYYQGQQQQYRGGYPYFGYQLDPQMREYYNHMAMQQMCVVSYQATPLSSSPFHPPPPPPAESSYTVWTACA